MDWTPTDTTVLVEGGYKGVTATPAEVTKLIENQGWAVNNVKWTKDSYVAQATNPHGEKKDAKGPTAQDALAQLLLVVYKLNASRASASRLAAITHEWLTLINDVSEVAQAYAKLPAYDMKASLAWHELSVDSKRRAAEIHRQLKVEVVDNPQPYPTAVEMFQDIRKKRHVFISRANIDHPLWSMEDVINFRLVHMVMGFAGADAPFGYAGEVMASSAHAQLLSANAKRALLTDRVGQSAYGYFYGHFVPKIAFMGDIEKSIGLEGDTSTGIHPSQTIVPAEIPKFGKILIAAYVADPNATYQTGVTPLQNNAYQWQGDPLDAHDEGGMMDTAGKVYTGWDNMKNADGTDDFATMKAAVVNALRVVLLSPRKDLKWNAIHYQHIQSVPADVDDPKRYWDTLEEQRENWNQARGYAPGSHKSYWKAEQQFYNYIRNLHPDEDEWSVKAIADREFHNIWNDLEEELTEDPKNSKKTQDEIERKVGREIDKRIQRILSPIKDEEAPQEQMSMFGARPAPDQEDFDGNPAQKYGAWMGAHMKALAQVSQHADELTRAAIQDARSGGEGYHFRQTLLGLDVSGVGPKVASFAWLLLKPQTSQLATIDTHMLDALGHNEESPTPRDYYCRERELAAGRDAAGYGAVPLGAFQWGMWDAKRTGIGTHQDHSAMKVLNPVDHNLIDWNHKQGDAAEDALKNDPRWQWWRDTQPARQAVIDDWQKNEANKYPQNAIPGQPLQNTPDPNTPEGMYAMDQAAYGQPVTSAVGKDKEEFCILCPLKPRDALDIYSWVCDQDWGNDVEIESPDDYHVTLLYSHTGFSDNSNHIWAKTRSQGGFPVTTGGLDLFGPDKDVAVIRLDGPELVEYTESMRAEGKARGLDISEFDGGYKAHMTIAKGVKKLPVAPTQHKTFRLEDAVVSLPRTQIRFSYALKAPWHINESGDLIDGNPGQSIMDHLRTTYAMTPEQVWSSGIDEVGKR
jgi:hypothetical protein